MLLRSPHRAPFLSVFGLLLLAGSPAVAHPGVDWQIRDVTAQILESPDDAGLYLRRGELHRIHSDRKAAESDYAKALKLDPELFVVELCRAKLLLEFGESKAALAPLGRYLEQHPEDRSALALRAEARLAEGEWLGAAADFDRALEIPESGGRGRPEYYIERARALSQAGNEHLDRALNGLEEGLKLLGEPITLQVLALDLEAEAGRTDAALARIDRILARVGRKESWLQRRGEILEAAQRLPEAVQAYQASLDAIEQLRPSRRRTRHTQELEQKVRASLERLESSMPHDRPTTGQPSRTDDHATD